MIDALNQVDQQLFLRLNGPVSPFIDQLMFAISGRLEWMPLYAILLVFIIRKYRWNSIWILVAVVVLITLSDQLANVLKDGVKRFRPCKDPDIGHLVHTVNNYCRSSYGFVSGHAANSFALATHISLLFPRRWIITAMVFWAVLVSYSRIYLGVHYPGDVLGGWILGALIAFVLYLFLKRIIILRIPNTEARKLKRI